MKLGETIVILVIFALLVVFGVVFYAKYQFWAMDEKMDENADLLAIKIVQKLQFLPEIQCTVQGTQEYNCVDLLKLKAVAGLPPDMKRIYSSMFPRTSLSVVQVYPETRSWSINEADAPGRRHFFPVPVALYNASAKQYYFGYLNITVTT